ncbi:MAG: hypothetical protein A3K75_04845 [Euryarchaeota archaeon RBG_13_61_15]|nr:MAG: hypothetical protein A3K75_04845 [Euryarchaeota archaeon RBG_13_61_15]
MANDGAKAETAIIPNTIAAIVIRTKLLLLPLNFPPPRPSAELPTGDPARVSSATLETPPEINVSVIE